MCSKHVHSTVTRASCFDCVIGVINKPTTVELCIYLYLFDFNRNRASVLYSFRDIAGYLSKVADFDPPHLHLVPP